ncbi:MAG: hypothetical protein A3E01_07715 [Gammaproteobacteria bacterium RIFCSPHIGHO2_12_FULL_63_22]|nr:MAG: hypothetical protein A3E01_07715 [Gammaproteobacteria bacterium RIFCSPHIGHO2_12_FULL_63_22]
MGDRIKVEGFVEKIFVKEGTNARGAWQAFSIKLQRASGEVDPRFFQFGFERPKFKEGDYVAFEAEVKDDKAAKFIEGSGSKPKNPPTKPAAPQRPGGTGGKPGGGGGYKPRPPVESKLFGQIGQNSTEDDVRRISYASARTAALGAVDILLKNDALPMSAAKTKAGQASRFDEVTAAIDKLTIEYFFDSATGRKLSTVADAGSKESRVTGLPTAEPGKAAAPAASETEAGDEPPQDDGDDAPPEDEDKF